jgi:hypothetical protein
MRRIDGVDFGGREAGFAQTDVPGSDNLTDQVASIGSFPNETVPTRQEAGRINLTAAMTSPQRVIPLSPMTPVWPRVFPGL